VVAIRVKRPEKHRSSKRRLAGWPAKPGAGVAALLGQRGKRGGEGAVDGGREVVGHDQDGGAGDDEVKASDDSRGHERDSPSVDAYQVDGSSAQDSSRRKPAPRTVTIRTPALTSFARSRLILTSIVFEPSGSVSSCQACSAIALRSTTVGDRRIRSSRILYSVTVSGSDFPCPVIWRRAGSSSRRPRLITGLSTPRGRGGRARTRASNLPASEGVTVLASAPEYSAE